MMRYLSLFTLLFVFACETPGSNSADGAAGEGGLGSQFAGVAAGELAPGVFDTVYFATDSSTLNSEAQTVLKAQSEWLAANSGINVLVEGHADERGTREYNLALGERRANSVKRFLEGAGVEAARLETISYGKERPVAAGSDAESWALNRRGVTVAK